MTFKSLTAHGPQVRWVATFLTLWIGMTAFSPSARAWTLNDVSVLLPLPAAEDISLLLSPMDVGAQGELIPYSIYQNLPHIVVGTDRKMLYSQHLKVVAIRIDPCFLERGAPMDCRRQIRMVWQPVLESQGQSITMDAALHSFYDLSEPEWQRLLTRLGPLAGKIKDEPLDVHPRILVEGLRGNHWHTLKKTLLEFTGAKNLSRVTAMTVDPLGSIWIFSGVDIKDGVATRIQIPRANHIAQGFFVDVTDLKEFLTRIRPHPENQLPFMNFITDSKGMKDSRSESEIREAMDQALRLENPKLEDTGSVDCVSCHVAQSIRLWGERNFTSWDWKRDFKTSLYETTGNVKNNSVRPGFVNRLRAFGYFVDEAVISQRLIHESTEVLHQIQSSECEVQLKKSGT